MELFRQLLHRQTDGRTDGRTLLVPKVAIATEKDSTFNAQKLAVHLKQTMSIINFRISPKQYLNYSIFSAQKNMESIKSK